MRRTLARPLDCGYFVPIENSSLVHLQAALARLYTDAAARAELQRAPQDFAARHGLSESEAAALAREILDEAGDFARSLQRKRFGEASRAIPLARETLGKQFETLFGEFAALTPLGAARNPAIDAFAFEQWVLAENRAALSTSGRDALRYEMSWLTMQHTPRRILVRWLIVPGRQNNSRAFAVWWRWRGRLRHWVCG